MDTQLIPIDTSTVPNLDSLLQNKPYVKSSYSTTKVFTGSTVVNFTSDIKVIFTDAQFKGMTGRSFNQATDCVCFMNGDWSANGWWGFCAVWANDTKEISAIATQFGISNGSIKGMTRLNYIIVVR